MLAILNGYGGNLIAAHHYNGSSWSEVTSGGTLSATSITSAGMSFTGFPWTPFGASSGVAVLNGDIYVGGRVSNFIGRETGYIARWDGSSWHSLGTGLNGTVTGLYSDGTKLYVGGNFTRAGDVEASKLAVWDGSSWSSMGYTGNAPGSFVEFGGELYVSGLSCSLLKWDGSSWTAPFSIGGGYGGCWIAATATELFITGYQFSSIDGVSVSKIAKWDGSSWSDMSGGLGDGYGTNIIAVGSDVYLDRRCVCKSYSEVGWKFVECAWDWTKRQRILITRAWRRCLCRRIVYVSWWSIEYRKNCEVGRLKLECRGYRS